MKNSKHSLLTQVFTAILVCMLGTGQLLSQEVKVSGRIFEKGTNEALPGVNITIEGTFEGTVSDVDGSFNLATNTNPPFKLNFTFVGYGKEVLNIESSSSGLTIEMEPRAILGQEVVISASRVMPN